MDEYKQLCYDIFGDMRSSTDEERQLYSDMLDKISIPITEDTNIFDIDLNEHVGTQSEKTCHDISEQPDNGFWPVPHFKCSLCEKEHISMDYVYYCPNCGAKVVGD